MRYLKCILAICFTVILFILTACQDGGAASSGDVTDTEPSATVETRAPIAVELAFERVSFEGDCHSEAHLRDYLDSHLEELMADMMARGIAVDAQTSIRAVPIHMINLLTGSVGLDSHFLPVIRDGALVNAVSVNMKNAELTISAPASWSWMAQIDRVLTDNPEESYLLTNCWIRGGNFICLISSRNEIVYIAKPAGEELLFEEGVDYYGRLYDERLVISYGKIHSSQE